MTLGMSVSIFFQSQRESFSSITLSHPQDERPWSITESHETALPIMQRAFSVFCWADISRGAEFGPAL